MAAQFPSRRLPTGNMKAHSAATKLQKNGEPNTLNNAAPPGIPVTLMTGDGIGAEITAALVQTFSALGSPFLWEPGAIGLKAYSDFGDPLPSMTIESFEKTRLAIKGPVQTPLITGFKSPLVRLRTQFQLYANLRQARNWIIERKSRPVDIVVVRENTEGLYAAAESYIAVGDDPHGIAIATTWNSRRGCEQILRFAFDYARRHKRRKVTVVHKANVLKILSGIFLETARELYRNEYAEQFEIEEMIVDACAMKLAMEPSQFDVIVTTNMFGDILSDLAAGVSGGLGLAPGANIGRDAAVFEAIHGSAPNIAGKGIANPVALLLSGAMLLDHVGKTELSFRLRRSIDKTLNYDRIRTPDIGGTASCADITAAIISRLD